MIGKIVVGVILVGLHSFPSGEGLHEQAGSAMQIVALQTEGPAATGAPEITEAQPSSGLPRRPPPPRTMRDYWPVFAGFTVVWIGVVGYVLSFNGRLKRVAERLASSSPAGGTRGTGGRR